MSESVDLRRDTYCRPGGPSRPAVLPAKEGYNRFSWNFRRDDLPVVEQVFVFGGNSGGRVGPGTYTLELSLGDQMSTTTAQVLADPRINATASDYTAQQQMLTEMEGMVTEIHESVNEMRSVRKQLKAYKELLEGNQQAEALITQGDSLIKRITRWEENLIQSKQKTFQDVINFNNKLNAEILYLMGAVDGAIPQVTQGERQRLNDLKKDWAVYQNERRDIVQNEMQRYNQLYSSLQLPALIMKED